jgi:hypothetical protein
LKAWTQPEQEAGASVLTRRRFEGRQPQFFYSDLHQAGTSPALKSPMATRNNNKDRMARKETSAAGLFRVKLKSAAGVGRPVSREGFGHFGDTVIAEHEPQIFRLEQPDEGIRVAGMVTKGVPEVGL